MLSNKPDVALQSNSWLGHPATNDPGDYYSSAKLSELDPFRPSGQHSYGSGTAEDGLHYHLKGDSEDDALAVNEFVLTRLAKLVHLPVVSCRVIMHKGVYLFGSETIFNLKSPQLILTGLRNGTLDDEAAKSMSKILAFDLLMCNPDRHYCNFLTQHRENDKLCLRVIDFSTAGTRSQGWRKFKQLDKASVTRKLIRSMSQKGLFDFEAAKTVLTEAMCLDQSAFFTFEHEMPMQWRKSRCFISLHDWFSNGRSTSLEIANQGLKDHE